MRLIPLTQGKVAKVDDEDYDYLNQWKWYAHKCGKRYYATRKERKDILLRMHRVLLNMPQAMQIDHIDGDSLNNQKLNLRVCTQAENLRNKENTRGGTSIFKGVSMAGRHKKWRSQIKLNSKTLHLGYFNSESEAAKIYDIAAKKYHGDFAKLNFS